MELRSAEWLNRHVNTNDKTSAGELIRDVHKDTMAMSDELTARMKEDAFVRVFLPFFLGKPKEELTYKVGMSNWASFAGNVYRKVHIVSDKNENEILFTVPPLMDMRAVTPRNPARGKDTLFDAVTTSQQLMRNGRIVEAKQYIQRMMAKHSQSMSAAVDVMEYVRTWNMIFTRYGHPPLLQLLEPDAPNKDTPDNAASDTNIADDSDWDLL